MSLDSPARSGSIYVNFSLRSESASIHRSNHCRRNKKAHKRKIYAVLVDPEVVIFKVDFHGLSQDSSIKLDEWVSHPVVHFGHHREIFAEQLSGQGKMHLGAAPEL